MEEIISKSTNDNQGFTFDERNEIVETNDNKWFIFNKNNTRIGTNQGHSVGIDLNLKPQQPPEFLYQGTAQSNINSILENGIEKRSRQHVHFS